MDYLIAEEKLMGKRAFQGQALVEFSLVIVILLMVIYGILEVGRLIFIYSSVVTSTREAVRYGALVGLNEAGDPFYQDCAGIRDTAKKVGFFLNLQDDDILIQYDTGPGTDVTYQCDATGVDEDVDLTFDDPQHPPRMLVKVTASYSPIVPLLPLSGETIVSSAARTVRCIVKLSSNPSYCAS